MGTNPFFSRYQASEQNLIEDLVVESIKIHGHDMIYLLRETVNVDELFGEDIKNKFTDSREIEMYIDSVDGFDGDGDFVAKFGLEIRDSMSVVVSKKRWKEVFTGTGITGASIPREGDLIYFPLSKGIFEITFVEHENPFYQLGKNHTFKLSCQLFKYSGETLDTGFTDIDEEVEEYKEFAIDLVLMSGSGDFVAGESVTQGDATAKVVSFNKTTRTLRITDLSGTITNGINIVGSSSGASWTYNGAGQTTTTVNTSPVNNDAMDIDLEMDDLVDFTITNPFGEDGD